MSAVCGAGVVAVLIASYKTGHIFKSLVLSSVQGIASLFAVNVIGMISGVTLAVNGWSIACSCVAGAPGVIFLLLTRLLYVV